MAKNSKTQQPNSSQAQTTQGQTLVGLDRLMVSTYQIREKIDPAQIVPLAHSIAREGLLQPLVGRPYGDFIELAFGARRLEALKLLDQIQRAQEAGTLEDFITGRGLDEELAAQVQDISEIVAAQSHDYSEIGVTVREMDDQAIFEAGIAENLQRSELNDIEKAYGLQVYMENFGATSAKAGSLFGMSGTAVRNYLRLLNLPETVQKRVAAGDITQTTARKLLTTQSLAGADVATKAAEKIAAGATPEDVDRTLEESLKKSKAVKKMWEAWRSEEPRGGEGLWPLATWTFVFPKPVSYADFTRNRPDIKRMIREDQAADESPEDRFRHWHDFLIGGGPLQKLLQSTVDAAQPAVEALAVVIQPPACLNCPFHTTFNKAHYCGQAVCWERKAQEWDNAELIEIQNKFGFPMIDREAEPVAVEVSESFYDYGDNGKWGQQPTHWVKMVEDRDPHLRLVLEKRTYNSWPFTKSMNVKIVSVHPDDLKRLEEKQAEDAKVKAERTEAQKQREAEQELKDRSSAFLWLEVTKELVPTLAHVPDALIETMVETYIEDNRLESFEGDRTPDFYRRVLLIFPVVARFREEARGGPVALLKALRVGLAELKIKLPKSLDAVAERYQTGDLELTDEEAAENGEVLDAVAGEMAQEI